MSDPESLVVADPMKKWFKAGYFANRQGEQAERWFIRRGVFALNPKYPDSIKIVGQTFPSLPALVKTYIAIDKLNSTEISACPTSVQAISYIIHYDSTYLNNNREIRHTIKSWREHMQNIEKFLSFAPNFARWDEHTKEIEKLANAALTESESVINAHIPAAKKLPQDVVDGIYVRVELLQNWTKSHLNKVRDRQDYKGWKKKQDVSLQSSQVRNRRAYRLDGTTTIPPLATPLTTPSTPPPTRSPKLLSMKFHLQGDITIWTITLLIYFPSTILQTLSFSHSPSSSPSSSEFLTAIQTTLTQLLSVIMTYALTIRNDCGCRLSMAYRAWFAVATVLPVVALGVVRWDRGASELVGFLGTVVTGILQVLLAVHMKRPWGLP